MRARLANDRSVVDDIEAEIVIFPANGCPDVSLLRPPQAREFRIRFCRGGWRNRSGDRNALRRRSNSRRQYRARLEQSPSRDLCHQKTNFIDNCTNRGSPETVIRPKLPSVLFTFGLAKFARFWMLNTSPRSCKYFRSVI